MNYKAKDFFALDEESVYSPSSPSSMSEGEEEEEQVASQPQPQPQPQPSDFIVIVSSDDEGGCSSPAY